VFSLADRLHQPLDTILDMSMEEFIHWIAFYNMEAKRIENGSKT